MRSCNGGQHTLSLRTGGRQHRGAAGSYATAYVRRTANHVFLSRNACPGLAATDMSAAKSEMTAGLGGGQMDRVIEERRIDTGIAAGEHARDDATRQRGSHASGKVIDLSLAGPGNFVAKRGFVTELAWFFLEACIINNKLIPVSFVRVALLRAFGARIGKNCRMPHPIRVKAPWNLTGRRQLLVRLRRLDLQPDRYSHRQQRVHLTRCVSYHGLARRSRQHGFAGRTDRDRRRRMDHIQMRGADGRHHRTFGGRHADVGRASLARGGRRLRRQSGPLHQKVFSRLTVSSSDHPVRFRSRTADARRRSAPRVGRVISVKPDVVRSQNRRATFGMSHTDDAPGVMLQARSNEPARRAFVARVAKQQG